MTIKCSNKPQIQVSNKLLKFKIKFKIKCKI